MRGKNMRYDVFTSISFYFLKGAAREKTKSSPFERSIEKNKKNNIFEIL